MNTKLDKFLFYSLAVVGLTSLNINIAEAQAFNDINHTRILSLSKYENVDGTPFLSENWLPGAAKLINGTVFNNLFLKYNQEEDQIYFKGSGDDEMLIFVDVVKEFSIGSPTAGLPNMAQYRNGYNIPDTDASSYFEVLVDGKMQLLKRTKKTIEEHKEYGLSVAVKKFVSTVRYYLYSNGKAVQTKLNDKLILAALNVQEAEKYVKENGLNLKQESNVVKLIKYCNTL